MVQNFFLYFWGNLWFLVFLFFSDVMVIVISNDSFFLNWTYNSNVIFVESWNVIYISLIDGILEIVIILVNISQYVVNYNVIGFIFGYIYSIFIYSVV